MECYLVVVGKSVHVGKLHKVGNLKYVVELIVGDVCLLVLLNLLHDLGRSHLYGVDAEAAVDIHTQDIGKLRVVFFLLTILP